MHVPQARKQPSLAPKPSHIYIHVQLRSALLRRESNSTFRSTEFNQASARPKMRLWQPGSKITSLNKLYLLRDVPRANSKFQCPLTATASYSEIRPMNAMNHGHRTLPSDPFDDAEECRSLPMFLRSTFSLSHLIGFLRIKVAVAEQPVKMAGNN